jgi:hypothetical protein
MMHACLYPLIMVHVAADNGLRPLFRAIRAVETSGMAAPDRAVGDQGRSIGPYQISRAYWVDSGVGGEWTRCRSHAYSEAVMSAYWQRHCPDALRRRDLEVLARVHNGGPKGHTKPETGKYWRKVEKNLMTSPALSRLAEYE